MPWNETEACWDDFADELRSRWTKLSAGDIAACADDRDILVSKLQKLYGMTKDEASLQIADVEQRAGEDQGDASRRYGTR